MWQHVKLADVSLGARPRYSLVVDEDVKKPTKQTDNIRVTYRRSVDWNSSGNLDLVQFVFVWCSFTSPRPVRPGSTLRLRVVSVGLSRFLSVQGHRQKKGSPPPSLPPHPHSWLGLVSRSPVPTTGWPLRKWGEKPHASKMIFFLHIFSGGGGGVRGESMCLREGGFKAEALGELGEGRITLSGGGERSGKWLEICFPWG